MAMVGGGQEDGFGERFDRYTKPEAIRLRNDHSNHFSKYIEVGENFKNWDIAPSDDYFEQLFRVSENQIIWGGNYFPLPPTRCFIVWKKLTISENFSMAMAEYAWTSFTGNAKLYECAPQGDKKDPRFHPTQKPVDLYRFVLRHFAQEGDTILDTHGGSMSSMIACIDGGFTATCIEINKYYYDQAVNRITEYNKQGRLF